MQEPFKLCKIHVDCFMILVPGTLFLFHWPLARCFFSSLFTLVTVLLTLLTVCLILSFFFLLLCSLTFCSKVVHCHSLISVLCLVLIFIFICNFLFFSISLSHIVSPLVDHAQWHLAIILSWVIKQSPSLSPKSFPNCDLSFLLACLDRVTLVRQSS